MQLSARNAALLTCLIVAASEEEEDDDIFRNCSAHEERLLRDYMDFAFITESELVSMDASEVEKGIRKMLAQREEKKKAEEAAFNQKVTQRLIQKREEERSQLKDLKEKIDISHQKFDTFFDTMHKEGLEYIDTMLCSNAEKEQLRKELNELHY